MKYLSMYVSTWRVGQGQQFSFLAEWVVKIDLVGPTSQAIGQSVNNLFTKSNPIAQWVDTLAQNRSSRWPTP